MKTHNKNTKGSKQFGKEHLHKDRHNLANNYQNSLERKSSRSSFIASIIEIKSYKAKKARSQTLLLSSISLCISLLIVIAAFEMRIAEDSARVELSSNTNRFEDLVEIPLTQHIQKPPAQMHAPTIIEVDDEEIIEEIEVDLDIEMTEETRIEAIVFKPGDDAVPEEKADEIFLIVEEQPIPVGGIAAFYDFVGSNLQYPARAARMGIEGRVFVEFVVEKDGSLTNIRVAKGIGGGCDEEAVRVLAAAPKWKAGRQRGNPVRVRMVMPIMFKLLT
jgi:protein TonB